MHRSAVINHLKSQCRWTIALFAFVGCLLVPNLAQGAGFVAPIQAEQEFPKADSPTKELMTQTLVEFYERLEAKDLKGAFALALAPPDAKPEILSRVLERNELSKKGIEELSKNGTFGLASDVLDEKRGDFWAGRANVNVESLYALRHQSGGIDASALAHWNVNRLQILNIDDIGKLGGEMAADNAVQIPVDPALRGEQPTKALLIATLKTVHSHLSKEKYQEASLYFVMPPKATPDDLAGLLAKRELSLPGIVALENDAKFSTAEELYGAERAKYFAERMGKSPSSAYGFKHEVEGSVAEVVAIWESNQFKLIRCDDVGKISAQPPGNSPPVDSPRANPGENMKVGASPKTTPPAVAEANDPAAIARMIPGLEAAVTANPNDIESRASYAMALFKIKNYPAAWKQSMEAYKLNPQHGGINKGVNVMIGTFANLGVFTVGVPPATVQGLLGEPSEKVALGKDRERWVFGHWGIDFKESKLHEIINLRGATAELFTPTEYITSELDGRYWMTLFRRKEQGKVLAFKFIPGETPANFKEQIIIERLLNAAGFGSMEEIANKQIADEKKAFTGVQHKLLEFNDETAYIAVSMPSASDQEARHQLVRLMKGPKDIHRLTYVLKQEEMPSQETQMKWLGIFKKAALKNVE